VFICGVILGTVIAGRRRKQSLCLAFSAADGIDCGEILMTLAETVKQADALANAAIIFHPHPGVYRRIA
jgi:hypothetical protein